MRCPASACFNIPMLCSSLKRLFLMTSIPSVGVSNS